MRISPFPDDKHHRLEKGLASCKPKTKILWQKLGSLVRQIFADGRAAKPQRTLGKTLPFVFETFYADCTLVGGSDSVFQSSPPPIPLAFRLEPSGENPSCEKHTTTIHRQFAAKANHFSQSNSV
jgi:hypothetical protein